MNDLPEVEAGPVVKVGRDLTAILEMHGDLLTQAVHCANDPLMPGGLAMVALGKVANIEAWESMQQATERYGKAYTSVDDEDPDEAWSAFQLLEFWSEQWRAERGNEWDHQDGRILVKAPERDVRPTIQSEANYLRGCLNWAWDNEAHWDDFASDIRSARVKLETITSAGKRAEMTRVECDQCEAAPRLMKLYASRYVTDWECLACGDRVPEQYRCDTCNRKHKASAEKVCGHTPKGKEPCEGRIIQTMQANHCRVAWCWSIAPAKPVWMSNEADDRWKCPGCKHWHDDDSMKRAHAKQLYREKAAKFVALGDAVGTLVAQGRPLRTVRKWLAPPAKEAYCDECKVSRWYPVGTKVCTKGHALEDRWRQDPESIPEGYCDLTTRKVWIWWPDMWRLHLTTKSRDRKAA